jgi:hypothetical protein
MQVTVEPEWVCAVQQALAQASGARVDVLATRPLPRTTEVRVSFGLPQTAKDLAFGAVLRAVPYGEIGRILSA